MSEFDQRPAAAEDNFASRAVEGAAQALSVSALNRWVRTTLERNFGLVQVNGEVSNFTRAPSGHWYLSLKDENSQVRCVMYRQKNVLLGWQIADGQAVEVRALVSLYEPRGEYQLIIESMRRAGVGALYERFVQLKAKLEREGLFEAERKRALPAFARRIGIITSPAAAALRDVLTVLRRRMPSAEVILYPSQVQGATAAAQLAAALQRANAHAYCDVLILCRGGGSLEDLWPFNEESVARAIAASAIPTICGVGHETDFSIADFVADSRAPTPTAAAALAVHERVELSQTLQKLTQRLTRAVERQLENKMQAVDLASRRLVHPRERLAHQRVNLEHLVQRWRQATAQLLAGSHHRVQQGAQRWRAAAPPLDERVHDTQAQQRRLARAIEQRLGEAQARMENFAAALRPLDPRQVLQRGYAIAQHANGSVIVSSRKLQPGSKVKLTFAEGAAETEVRSAQLPLA